MLAEINVMLLAVLLSGLLMAGIIYRTLAFVTRRSTVIRTAELQPLDSQPPVFLFDNDFLIDATPSASHLVANRNAKLSEYDALIGLLERQFPTIRAAIETLSGDIDAQVLTADKLGLKVKLERRDGMTRISLGGPTPQDHIKFAEIERAAQTEELALLRNMTDNAPQMIWLEDTKGDLLWANSAYLAFCDQMATAAETSETIWPGDRIFENIRIPEPGDLSSVTNRYSVSKPGEPGEHWFDITSVPQAGGVLHYANVANNAVRAELAKREFQQTLSKTFAQLSTGLAIFDRGRKLTMFNPALLDLIGLPVDFLSARPSIEMFMDRLREANRLPEPKNYHNWREQFAALQSAAENGGYFDVWDLPDGQTFRVTGRPHPNGALAFLFEDISAEVLLTRRFRTEIETGQAVLDTLPDAIAVFSNANTLVMTNAAYDDLWGGGEHDLVLSRDLRGAIRTWKSKSAPTRIWTGIENLALTSGERLVWSDSVTFTDGRHAICHAIPLAGGMTMVKFVFGAIASPGVRKIAMGDPVPRMAKT